VLGLGNILLRDEGIGVQVVQRLQERYEFPLEVQVLDGGTLGMEILPYVEAAAQVVVVDAVEMGAEPGTTARFEGEDIPEFLSVKVSPHQMGLVDLLAVARLRDLYPEKLVLWGVQPDVIEVGLDLSPRVAEQVEVLVDKVLDELNGWGIEAARKAEQKGG
jgi:hydrogenase maturation protease